MFLYSDISRDVKKQNKKTIVLFIAWVSTDDHPWPTNPFKEEHFAPDSAVLKCNYWDRAAHPSPNKHSQQKSQDALPWLQPLIRHGLISKRRCYREQGGHPSSQSRAALFWLFVCRSHARSWDTIPRLLPSNKPDWDQGGQKRDHWTKNTKCRTLTLISKSLKQQMFLLMWQPHLLENCHCKLNPSVQL